MISSSDIKTQMWGIKERYKCKHGEVIKKMNINWGKLHQGITTIKEQKWRNVKSEKESNN